MNIGLGKSDFVVELALHLGKAFVGSKLDNSSTYFCQISA